MSGVNPRDKEYYVDAHCAEGGGSERQWESQELPFGSRIATFVSIEAEVLAKLTTQLEEVRRLAEKSQIISAKEVDLRNRKMAEEIN